MKRLAGKAKHSFALQKDKDESIVFFRELYKREKERDVNLLEPIFSVEFEAIQVGRISKLPSRKRDFTVPEGEKNDYDWLMTPPATPLFPSLEMEPNPSKMVFQKELPMLRPAVKPSRFSDKPEASKTSTRLEPPGADSSSKKSLVKVAPALSKQQNLACTIDKRLSDTTLTNKQCNAVPATTKASTSSNATKKHSDKKSTSQGSATRAVKKVTNPEFPYKAPKNLVTTASIFPGHAPPPVAKYQSKDLTLGVGNFRVDHGKNRRECLPAVTRRINKKLQLEGTQYMLAAKGKTQTGSESSSAKDDHAVEAILKGMRRAGGKKEQGPKFATQAKK